MLSRGCAVRAWQASALLVAAACWGQNLSDLVGRAPADVDEALKARAHQWYRAHIDRKYRQAEALVAEDSKDLYFEAQKPHYFDYELGSIKYFDNFTRATVLALVEVEYNNARLGTIRLRPPVSTNWKLENNQWFIYIEPPSKQPNTPWGKMDNTGKDTTNARVFRPTPDLLRKMVAPDKSQVTLPGGETASQTVSIKNEMQGAVGLSLEPINKAGLTAKLDKDLLQAGEVAHLVVEWKPLKPEAHAPTTVVVQVSPISHRIPIKVDFTLPPEIQKLIPKGAPLPQPTPQ